MNLQDLRTMLDYHYWARDRLLAALEPLTPEQYNRDLANSFRSIRETVTHVYAAEWEPGVVRFYVDSNNYATFTQAELPKGGRWVFDHPFFIILNLAVGGDWPKNPDATSQFPQQMLVDYVRVYTRR